MRTITIIGISILVLSIGVASANDADNLVSVLKQSKVGTNKLAVKDLTFRKTETGKVRETDEGLSRCLGGNMVVHFVKVTRRSGNVLSIIGHITNDNIGFRMPDVSIVLGNARYTKGAIVARRSFRSDRKGHFEIRIEPKEGEKLYFMNDGWPVEEYAVHELRIQEEDNKAIDSDKK